jgi:hypothetical protein
MAKFKIRENFSNGASHSMIIPAADEATALLVGQSLLDGELEVLEAPADVTATEALSANVGYKRFDLTLKDSTTGDKAYYSFLAKATITTLDVQAYFVGKSINGVHADTIDIRVKSYSVA